MPADARLMFSSLENCKNAISVLKSTVVINSYLTSVDTVYLIQNREINRKVIIHPAFFSVIDLTPFVFVVLGSRFRNVCAKCQRDITF